jgi:hypothetical protein
MYGHCVKVDYVLDGARSPTADIGGRRGQNEMPREIQYRNESDVKKQVKKLLTKHGWFWWMPPANAFGRSGISDINAIKAGVFLAIETKFGKNQPTIMQKSFLVSVQSESGFAFVVDETRVEWLDTWLATFDRSVECAAKKEPVDKEDVITLINAVRALSLEII